jgi:hypothetical protein
MLVISFEEMNNPEIKSELENKLKEKHGNVFLEFSNFSLESCPEKWIQKRKLFQKENVKFQGQQKLTSISELLPDHENLYNDIDQETIMTLITKQLEIGKPTDQNEFMQAIENVLEKLFIERNFQMKNVISDPDKINDDENGFQLLSGLKSLNPQANVKENCHHLAEENRQTIWMKSTGSIKKIQDIPTENSTYSEAEIVSKAANVNIIVGEPGKGKSVCLSHLEKTFKKSNPLLCVQRINLSDVSSSFKSCSANHFTKQDNEEISTSTDKCLAFLTKNCLKIASNFEKCLFRKMLSNVILLLDGLDELSPDQKDKCIKWVHGLAQTDIFQIWITARSLLQTELEL